MKSGREAKLIHTVRTKISKIGTYELKILTDVGNDENYNQSGIKAVIIRAVLEGKVLSTR